MTTTHTLRGSLRSHLSASVGDGDDLITYDVHGDLSSGTPLFLFGSPMDASGFQSLAARFTDRPVVTYDPRGAGRNPTATSEISVEQHADDLHRVISALDAGPVDVFASSGGAVNALALCAAHPADVRAVVAHEPPTSVGLPDEELVMAAITDMKDTYAAAGDGPAMAKFIQLVMRQGELTPEYLDQPDPDPAMFGQPVEDDGSRGNPLMRNMPACNLFEADAEALAPLGDRLVIAVGTASGEGMAARGGRAVAARIGRPVADFPGDHGNFLDGGYGEPTGVDEAAARLRELLGS